MEDTDKIFEDRPALAALHKERLLDIAEKYFKKIARDVIVLLS